MKHIVTLLILALFFTGCQQNIKKESEQKENEKAKALLKGIWKDADEEIVAFLVKGDTIYYPDSTSQPVYFEIIDDTLVLKGNSISKYPIIRQEAHIFEFKNQSDDIVKFIKSEDPNDSLEFIHQSPKVLNQRTVIKRDTIISLSDNKYHCYVQINPTTYKVFRTSYNSEGIEVENVYYDNIIHISIFKGANKIFSKDFYKKDFNAFVPDNMLKQCILSDIVLDYIDDSGIHYNTQLALPDSPSSFIVKLAISFQGKISMHVAK